MGNKTKNSQITNWFTYQLYLRRCKVLAENVFQYKGIPSLIDIAYVNKNLVTKGSIAFFYDEEIESLVALPYTDNGFPDLYGRPTLITVNGANGYQRTLKKDEFVIMYDNNGYYPLIIDLYQYAERLAIDTRTIDVNIIQQRTPRIWQCKEGQETTLKAILDEVDSFSDSIKSYANFDLEEIQAVIAPAPFIADKVREEKIQIWNEFLCHIGIANVAYQKKERNIRDEILAMQGGTIASRFSRFEPRQSAIELINKKWNNVLNEPIEVGYYDGIPTTEKETLEDEEETIYDI